VGPAARPRNPYKLNNVEQACSDCRSSGSARSPREPRFRDQSAISAPRLAHGHVVSEPVRVRDDPHAEAEADTTVTDLGEMACGGRLTIAGDDDEWRDRRKWLEHLVEGQRLPRGSSQTTGQRLIAHVNTRTARDALRAVSCGEDFCGAVTPLLFFGYLIVRSRWWSARASPVGL
jgi:hypothetical protein